MSDQSNSQPIIVKRVKKKAAHGHSSSWKVAFADFMTAMMAFFLVMWILGLDEESRSMIAGYFKDPLEFMEKRDGNRLVSILDHTDPGDDPHRTGTGDLSGSQRDQEITEMSAIAEEIREAVAEQAERPGAMEGLAEMVEIEATEEGLVLEFLEGLGSAFFATGSAQLNSEGRQLFATVGTIIARHDHNFVVDGHTDSQPFIGTGSNNLFLSQDRARSVVQTMLTSGVQESHVLAVRGFGDKMLRDEDDPFHFTNRRVTVLLPYKWKEVQVIGTSGAVWEPPVPTDFEFFKTGNQG